MTIQLKAETFIKKLLRQDTLIITEDYTNIKQEKHFSIGIF